MENRVVLHRKRPTGLGTGSPDLLIAIPGCPRGTEILFAELKTEEGRRSADQVKWHEDARRFGLRVETIRSVTELVATITAIRFGRAA